MHVALERVDALPRRTSRDQDIPAGPLPLDGARRTIRAVGTSESTGGLFGRIALKKGLVAEVDLRRALRFQEELRALGLDRPLGRILVAEGVLAEGQVELILRLQAVNVRARQSKAFLRVAARNALVPQDLLDDAMRLAREEGFSRTVEAILVERDVIDTRSVRAVHAALARSQAARDPAAAEDDEVDGDDAGGERREASPTARIAKTLQVADDEQESPEALLARRRHDVLFAAVALRDGLVLVSELERALEEQQRRPEQPALERVLVERGVLVDADVKATRLRVEDASRERLTIPGYEVKDVLGYGVTSIVLRARHTLIGREVAIKLFRPEHVAAQSADGLIEEARQLARVRHPSIVELFEVGRVHRRIFYVMELVSGRTLAERVRDEGALPERVALRVARDVAGALTALHDAGLVHRDVKPQNVLLSTDGRSKLTDLGLACESGRPGVAPTPMIPGAIYGSPQTMAPEQAQGDAVDARADLYGLGATLFHALTEHPPFEGKDALAMMMAHITEPVPDPRALRGDVSEAAAALVMALLAKRPEDRPADAAEVARRLDALLGAG